MEDKKISIGKKDGPRSEGEKDRGESRYRRTKREDGKGNIKQKLVRDKLAEI